MLPIRETLERTDRVIADGRYAESLLPDRVQALFQLDELDLAEGSPIRGTEEEENRSVRCLQTFQCLLPPKLVAR